MDNANITFFGQTSFRGKHVKFGIKRDDKRRHVYVIGKTGMGKTELLKNMIVQDIKKGNGICFVDPHGDAAEEILQLIPSERIQDVVYFNPADLENPIAFNIMEDVGAEYRHLIAGGIMAVFKKIWPDVWSSRMEYILNNCLLALLEVPGSTLLGINKMLSNPEWRETIVSQVKDPVIKAFWTKEFARYSQRYETEATAAIQNKIGQFISAPLIRNIIGQPNSALDMRDIMDNKKIFIVNLSKGRIGEESSRLLGALLITKLQLAAMSRVDIPEATRNDFILYIDEFQNFSTDSFANILSEARKYRLSLVLAHQYIAQMEEKVRDAVFGNVGTMIVFRVGADDAEFLEREFSPEFTVEDIVNLPKQNIYLKLMIDGVSSRPFSASTLPPVRLEEEPVTEKIVDYSRLTYATPRALVEEKIARDTEDEGAGSGEVREQPAARGELFDTICSSCNKKMKVPFKPDGKRPVYCKSCLKKMEQDPDSRVRRPPTEAKDREVFKGSEFPKRIEREEKPLFKKEIRSNYIGPSENQVKEEVLIEPLKIEGFPPEETEDIKPELVPGITNQEEVRPRQVVVKDEREEFKEFSKSAMLPEIDRDDYGKRQEAVIKDVTKEESHLPARNIIPERPARQISSPVNPPIRETKRSSYNDTPKEKSISLEETSKRFIPEEKTVKDTPVRTKVEEQKSMETKSGKKIDFEGLMDIIKKETKPSDNSSNVINPGDKIKFD